MGKSKWLSLVEAGCRVLGRLPFVDNRAITTARDKIKKSSKGKSPTSVCRLEFLKYLEKAKSKGRLPPCPKSHDFRGYP